MMEIGVAAGCGLLKCGRTAERDETVVYGR